ncbi:MAG: PAS domain S-box protein [Candidatus Obscuribacterales bacterium]
MGRNMDVDRLKAAESAQAVENSYLKREIEATKKRIAHLKEIAEDPQYLAIPTTFISDPVPVMMLDSDLKLLEANHSFATLSGYSSSELTMGADVRFFFPKSAHKHLEKAKQHLSSSNAIEPWETEVLTKNGERRPVIAGLTKNGPADHDWILFFFDLSARRQLQKELAIRESNLHALAEAIPQLLWVCGADGLVTYGNGGFFDFTGLNLDAPLNWTSLLHPTDKVNFDVTGFSVGELYADFQCEVRLRGKSSSSSSTSSSLKAVNAVDLYDESLYRWHLLKVVPFFNADQASMSWLVIATDVNDQRRVTEALLASEEQLRIIADAMPQIVWTANSRGIIEFWNYRWFEYTGLTVQQSLQGGWRLLIHTEDLGAYDQKWKEAVGGAEPFEVRFRLKRALGLKLRRKGPLGKPEAATVKEGRRDYLWHLCRAVPVKDSQGAVVRWFGTWTEIDEHKAE